VTDLGELVFSNPELIRNLRILLRPKRMLIAAAITGIVSLVILPALWTNGGRYSQPGWGEGYLTTILVLQAVVLLLGGGTACLQSISREKELNTFDYQRITRLSPLELSVGKLLGAPAMAYFITICLVPATLFGFGNAAWKLEYLTDIWVLLAFCAVAFHSLTLVVSMLLKRSPSTGVVLLLLFFVGLPGLPWRVLLLSRGSAGMRGPESVNFYGVGLPHTPFYCFVYASFAAWFILALERNIKRDPAAYELLTPLQALGFAGWINFIFIGLNPLKGSPAGAPEVVSLWMNVTVFFVLGLVLLRNRDRARRRLRRLGEEGLSWLEAFWPAPYILIGVVATGFLSLVMEVRSPIETHPWNLKPEPLDLPLFLFRLAFVALWLCRDMLYLQWMNLRPGRKPLLRAMLYGFVYYVALFVLFFTRTTSAGPAEGAFQSIFVPVRALVLDAASWNQAFGAWSIALASQAVVAFFFAFLHRQELQSLASRPRTYPTAAPPSIPPSIRPAIPGAAG